jgi:putative transposase
MVKDSTKAVSNILLGSEWHDSIEACVRTQIRGFIEEILEAELSTALGRARYVRARAPERLRDGASESGPEESEAAAAQRVVAHRNGHRDRELMGTFGQTTVSVPRARVETADGETTEWKSKTLSAYRRRTKEVDALIAGSVQCSTTWSRVI